MRGTTFRPARTRGLGDGYKSQVQANGDLGGATLMTGHITVIAPGGQVVRQVKMPDVYPTNICFGGPDLKTAFITLSGTGQLAAMDWPEPGLRLNFMC